MPSEIQKIKRKVKNATKKALNKAKPFVNEKAIEKAIVKAGEKLGEKAGSKSLGRLAAKGVLSIPKLVGHGDYQLHMNSLMASGGVVDGAMNQPARFSSAGRGVRVQEREFVGPVYGNILFNNETFPINPSNARTFPWLSSFANNFDQWEPHGIVFEYRTLSSDYAANTALGLVVLSTDYDVTDPLYADRTEAENSDYAISSKPSHNMMAGIECSTEERPTKVLYTGAPPPGRDPNLFTLANFQVITQGLPANQLQLGELWVSYDITFYKKQLNPPTRGSDASFVASTGIAAATPFGTLAIPTRSWDNGYTVYYTPASNVIVLPEVNGQFIMTARIVGTGIGSFNVTSLNGVTLLEELDSNSSTIWNVTLSYQVNISTSAAPELLFDITATTVSECVINFQQVRTGQPFRG